MTRARYVAYGRASSQAGSLPNVRSGYGYRGGAPDLGFRSNLRRYWPHALVALDILLIGAASYLAISHLLSDLSLSPDSSSYINAAQNFAETGRLVVFVNSPSRSMSPKVEAYTEQPPGLPIYFAPFMLLFDDPVRSAVVAQAVVIVCLFLFLYLFDIASFWRVFHLHGNVRTRGW